MSGKASAGNCRHEKLVLVRPAMRGRPNTNDGPYVVCRGCGGARLAKSSSARTSRPKVFADGGFGIPLSVHTPRFLRRHIPEGASIALRRAKGSHHERLTHPARRP